MAIVDFSSTVVKSAVFYALAPRHKLYDHVFHREYCMEKKLWRIGCNSPNFLPYDTVMFH